MKLELRNVRHFASMSQETQAYEASVYLDGKRFCAVGNRGNGGCDEQRPYPSYTRADIDRVNAWLAENMPPTKVGEKSIPCDLETWCGQQLERTLAMRDLRRRMARAVIYVDGGKCYTTKVPYVGAINAVTQRVKAKYPNATILNNMHIDRAVDLYLETAV